MSELSWVGIYGAALSTALLAWEIAKHWLVSRPRARLSVRLVTIVSSAPAEIQAYLEGLGTVYPRGQQIIVQIANIGAVPISIEEGGFLTSRRIGWRREHAKRLIIPYPTLNPLPHDLAPHKSYYLFGDVDSLLRNLNEPGGRITHIYFRDAVGRVYRKRLRKSFLKGLESLRSHNSSRASKP